MPIGNDTHNKQKNRVFKIGDMKLEYTKKYKYLGYTYNEKSTLKDHVATIKGKTEMTYQTIVNLLANKEFGNIQMAAVWKLVETCIIPIITYASETWKPNKQEQKNLNQILDNIIKRILMTPTSTPREALYIETNLLDITRIIEKKKPVKHVLQNTQ